MAQKPREVTHRAQIHRLRLELQSLDPHVFKKTLAQLWYVLVRQRNLLSSD
jgi:hypothetical protein